MNFTKLLLDATRERESPSNFWRWSSYAIVAAVLRDNVYFDYGSKVYPNIYVVLLADSAEYRKGAGISIASELLEAISHTKRIRGRTSAQGILNELCQDVGIGKTVPIKGGSCILLADEVASFFIADPQLIEMLTDIHDSSGRPLWDYNLKSTGKIVIKQPCVTMLAASNETLLKTVYDQRAIYGGLLGRTFFVKPDETRKHNSLIEETDEKQDEILKITDAKQKGLIACLEDIKKLKGRVKFTTDAAVSYNYWYEDLYRKYKQFPDKTGVTQRMHTQALKLSIILAASMHSLEINKEIVEEAILRVAGLKQNYEMYAMTTGRSELATPGAIFLNILWTADENMISRRQFIFNYWNQISLEELEKVVATFRESDMIQEVYKGNDVYYQLTQKAITEFTKRMNTKKD